MASPQVEDGYTPIANDLLEAMIRADFNKLEWKLVMTVARAAYGWSQKATTISKLELFRRADLRPDHGYRTLRDLVGRQVLTETAEGLGIQKDYDLWQRPTSPKTGLDRKQVQTENRASPKLGSVTRPELGSVTRPKSGLSKSRERPSDAASQAPKSISKSITKTNIADAPSAIEGGRTRKPPGASASQGRGKGGPKIHPETDPCIQLFSEQFSRKFEGRTYQVEWARDRKLVSELVKGHGPEVVQEQVRTFFRYPPQWVREKGRYDILAFRSAFNQLQALKGQGDL